MRSGGWLSQYSSICFLRWQCSLASSRALSRSTAWVTGSTLSSSLHIRYLIFWGGFVLGLASHLRCRPRGSQFSSLRALFSFRCFCSQCLLPLYPQFSATTFCSSFLFSYLAFQTVSSPHGQ
eukprot:Rmarinus@m.25262